MNKILHENARIKMGISSLACIPIFDCHNNFWTKNNKIKFLGFANH